jgi:ribonuclease H / adenosylcobalamin/alpha-ribazole phosphatase
VTPADATAGADLGAPVTLLLIRHATTGATGAAFSGGACPGPALDPAGERVASRLARHLTAPSFPGGVRPSVLITSPVLRALQTAQAVADGLGLDPQPDAAWAELLFGEWDGLSTAEVVRGWPDAYRDWRGSEQAAPPGGESLAELTRRVLAARDDLAERYAGRCVAVVTHTGPIRALLCAALDAGTAGLWRLRIDPGSVSVLRLWSDGGCEIATVNAGAGPPAEVR